MLVGFEEAVREVLCNQVRPCLERQSLLFSATYADEVMELEHGFDENDPLRICVGSKSISKHLPFLHTTITGNDVR